MPGDCANINAKERILRKDLSAENVRIKGRVLQRQEAIIDYSRYRKKVVTPEQREEKCRVSAYESFAFGTYPFRAINCEGFFELQYPICEPGSDEPVANSDRILG